MSRCTQELKELTLSWAIHRDTVDERRGRMGLDLFRESRSSVWEVVWDLATTTALHGSYLGAFKM